MLEVNNLSVSYGGLRALTDGDGVVSGAIGCLSDVTDQANAEDALRASEARNRRVIDSLAEGIILSGEGGRIVACNPAAVGLLGLSADNVLEHTAQDPRWILTRRDGSLIATATLHADCHAG